MRSSKQRRFERLTACADVIHNLPTCSAPLPMETTSNPTVQQDSHSREPPPARVTDEASFCRDGPLREVFTVAMWSDLRGKLTNQHQTLSNARPAGRLQICTADLPRRCRSGCTCTLQSYLQISFSRTEDLIRKDRRFEAPNRNTRAFVDNIGVSALGWGRAGSALCDILDASATFA